MKINFLCPRWGFEQVEWKTFLEKVKVAGYDGIEWFPFGKQEDPYYILELLQEFGLCFSIVMAVTSPWKDFTNYTELLQKDLYNLTRLQTVTTKPLFISTQTGREYFNQRQILKCLEICKTIDNETGITILQETHRNKWSYGLHTVHPMLEKYQMFDLTLDLSHWFCVSESYLEDQWEKLKLVIDRTQHIHARIGHMEGAQVFDPRLFEYQEALQAHLKIWDLWINNRKLAGFENTTITPEFGPQPYLTRGKRNIDLLEEQWNLNLWMKDFLEKRYNPETNET